MLGVETQSLRGRSAAQRPIFNHAIDCTWALLEFFIYTRFKSHDDATLSCTEDALRPVDTFKVVLLLGRVGNKAKATGNALRTELVKKQKVEKDTNSDSWTPSKKQREMNAPWDNIIHELDMSKELHADMNLPKIHFMSYCAEQIR
jgi:hypothetical protein